MTDVRLIIDGRDAVRTGRGARIRAAAGLTQAELAELAGVTPAAISRWEAGARVPRAASAARYAGALRKIALEAALHD